MFLFFSVKHSLWMIIKTASLSSNVHQQSMFWENKRNIKRIFFIRKWSFLHLRKSQYIVKGYFRKEIRRNLLEKVCEIDNAYSQKKNLQ